MIKGKDLTRVKMLVMDVDGTLTDGKIYVSSNGEIFKAFNVRDGYRLINIKKYGIIPVIITGRYSDIVARRAAELNIDEVHQGVSDKIKVLETIISYYDLTYDNVAYIGDDVNDISCMEVCYFRACPADAAEEVLEVVDYICKCNGGNGVVREVIDLITLRKHSNDK